MNPYYSDESVTLYHGDCREVLPMLDVRADVLLTDPPYFKVKEDEWDNQWEKSHEFLSWLGNFLDMAKPLLQPHASVWVFASPVMTSSVERLVGERFRGLNSIRWVKEQGWHKRSDVASLRRFLTPWEGIIFAEQDRDYSPVGQYLRASREMAELDPNDVDLALGYVRTKDPNRGTELCRRWEEGSSIPNARDYERLKTLLSLTRSYSELIQEYEDLRRPFKVGMRANSTDVWNFPTVAPYPGKHPCEKPWSMLRHMIETSSKPGQLILDPFAGSGSTLVAARELGREAVGVELEERYCEIAAQRLSQGVLDFGEATA